MNIEQKSFNSTRKPNIQNFLNNQEIIDKNKIYDDEFVSLINGLNESIKEFYKVSIHNISETNTIISYYEEQGKSIEILLNEIINSNQFQKMDEFIEKISQINMLINQLKINSTSSQKNLDLFFEDAKILFKRMKLKRKEKLEEIKNNTQNSDTFKSPIISINPFLSFQKVYSQIINLLNKMNDYSYIISGVNTGMANEFINLQKNISKELEFLMNMIRNNLINANAININSYNNSITNTSNNYPERKRSKSQTNSLNKEFERMKNIIKNNEMKIKELTKQLNIYKNNLRESGKLTDTEIRISDSNKNSLNLKIKKLEQLIKEKDIIISAFNNSQVGIINDNNSTKNLSQIIMQKDAKISELEQELIVYQKNENILNTQIPDLNNKLQMKINQYENQISLMNNKNVSLNRIIMNKNKEILKLQNEKNQLSMKLNQGRANISNIKIQNMDSNSFQDEENIQKLKEDLEKYKNMNKEYENQIMELSNNGINNNKDIEMLVNKNNIYEQRINKVNLKYNNLYKIVEDQKMTLNQLNKEIINYKKKEKINEETNAKYLKQIDELNTNILSTNKIIKAKDELIKQLSEKEISAFNNQNNGNNSNNNKSNEIFLLKMENENLKKQLEEFQNNILQKNNINNNLIKTDNIKDIQDLNIRLKEENKAIQIQNSDLLKKIKELTLQDKQIQDSFSSQKDAISKLESDLVKKNEELEGLKTFIFKLQSQLESKADKQEKEMGSSLSLRKKSNNLDNKSFEGSGKDATAEKMKVILNKLNDAEKQISILQNKNRDLQFQLEDKQIQKELQGFRTEDNNISNYEEEFDLKKMVNGARDKNRSEDINIDYPGVQGIKDKYKELLQNMNMLEEQVKILICNMNINNKVRPQIRQICQLMRISAKNIELIIAGKDKKKALGLMD